jgi:hypothetical protein
MKERASRNGEGRDTLVTCEFRGEGDGPDTGVAQGEHRREGDMLRAYDNCPGADW